MSLFPAVSGRLTLSLTDGLFIILMASAAIADARSLRIPNVIPLAVVVLFVAAFVCGLYHPLGLHFASFAISTAVGGVLFYAGIWGGGDAKLLAAIGLFLVPGQLAGLALTTALAGGMVALFVLLARTIRHPRNQNGARLEAQPTVIPYGIALAAAGFNWCFTAG